MKKNIIVLGLLSIFSSKSHAQNNNHNQSLERFGDVAQFGIPAIAGLISWHKGDYEGLFQLGEGAFYTAAITHAAKFSINAKRPNGGKHSFPSGHTSAATQGAAYLQFRYGWTYGLPAYTAAAIVGYSRVDANKHYWRDVAAGAALATATQYVITKMGYTMSNVYVSPYVEGDSTGIKAEISF